MDNTGATVAQYTYNAWGRSTSIRDGNGNAVSSTNTTHIANLNPFRYRGYYFDTESELYYLQSRYYDPQTGRFINADSQVNPDVLGTNLFAYCGNNPVNNIDPNGKAFMFLTAAIGAVTGAVVGGITAACTGGNILAGIGIGAAAGGLIGLGAGAAAGVMLAGSATASTAAVTSGGAALASTISAGGLGAGATYIADNISQAVGRTGGQAVSQVAQTGKKVYYQVTSSQAAKVITETGKVVSQEGGGKSLVYSLNFQPTLSQAQNLGARSVETVVRFTTKAPFEPDTTCGVNGALRSVFNGPIKVFDVTEVGFK